MADKIGLGKSFTLVVAAMIHQLLTENAVMWLPPSMLWGNTIEKLVNRVQLNYPGIISDEWQWYELLRQKSVLQHLLEIQTTRSLGHPAITMALE